MLYLLHQLLVGLWVAIPAYAANGTAPIVGGNIRIDGGKKIGERGILGAGKTVEGFISAVTVGFIFGILLVISHSTLNPFALEAGFSLPEHTLLTALLIPIGAMLGDMVASFIKRRIGLKRGAHAPLLDQLDFIIGSFVVVYPFLDYTLTSFVMVLVITPIIHVSTNRLAYWLGMKDVPW